MYKASRIAFAVFAAVWLSLFASLTVASRNAAGTMSAANGPYIGHTTISVTQVNSRFSDVESEITDSLSRSGKGGMLAALRGVDGAVSAPAYSFTSEVGSGLYRIGASDLGWAIGGAKKLELTGSLFSTTVAQTNTIAAGAAFTGLSGAAGSNVTIGIGRTVAEGALAVSAGANQFAQGSAAGDIVLRTTGSKLWVDTNSGTGTPSLAIAAGNGGVIIGGGQAISGSFRGTVSWNPGAGTVNANSCASTGVTVTGAVQAADCTVGLPTTPVSQVFTWACSCSAANTCSITICNPTAVATAAPNGTYAARVFNP
jgi:hypothetical protein